MRKPEGCERCPFYGDGRGFLPPCHSTGTLVVVDGYPNNDDMNGIKYTGYDEHGKPEMVEVAPGPFLGYKGLQLEKLGYAHISKQYILQCQPPFKYDDLKNSKRIDKYTLEKKAKFLKAVQHCNMNHRKDPSPDTKLVIAHGNLAWDFFNDQLSLGEGRLPLFEWRGFISPYHNVVKQDIYGVNPLENSSWDKVERYLSKNDWGKIPSILNHTWPIKEPTNVINVTRETDPASIRDFFNRYLEEAITPLVIDTEYTVKDSYLRLFGCGYHTALGEYYLQLYWSNSQNRDAPRGDVVAWMFDLKNNTTHQGFLFQNAGADNPILDKAWRGQGAWGWPSNYQDTMLLHAKLESELPHSLMFMESIYSRRAKKKHLSDSDELKYHLGDLSTTLDVWLGLNRLATPGMIHVYEQQDKPVFPLTQWSKKNGIRVDHKKVEPLYEKLQDYMAHARKIGETYCGRGAWFNINSDQQCKDWFYGREQFDIIRDRTTRNPSINGDALLKLRKLFSTDYQTWEPEEGGERWNPELLEDRIYVGECHPLLEAKSAYNYYEDKVAKYIRNDLFEGEEKRLRVYPSIGIHSQATGRHSTTRPPLAQWPDELQDLLTPDPGFMWIGGDFSGQEVWIYSCIAKDEKTLEALRKGYDTHTIAMCDFFSMDYPPDLADPYNGAINEPWREKYAITGKKDKRRDWSKSAKFALQYLKKKTKLHLVPGARTLGIDADQALGMAEDFLRKNPAIDTYRNGVLGTRPTQSVTFDGRVRKLNETGEKLYREYINSPVQGSGADMLNYTIIRACGVDPDHVHYLYGVHDSFWFEIPLKMESILVPRIKDAINQPYNIYGYDISIPVDWKTRYSTIC